MMDELNNHQMILLTGLVAFVTSIATGIITVALLQESPQTLTQTVNRVVEKTIERVVPAPQSSTTDSQPQTITREVTKEVTVFAKEDDLVVSAVEKNQPRVVQIYALGSATGTTPIGSGFVVSRDGLVVTTVDNLLIDGALRDKYAVLIGEISYASHHVAAANAPNGLAFLQLESPTKVFDAVSFGRVPAKIGQTVVLLGGDEGASIFKTTLSRLVTEKTSSTSTISVLSSIETTPRIPEGNNGSLVVNLDGVAVGMCVWNEGASRYIILPSERIFDAIDAVAKSQEAGSVLGVNTTTP